MSSRRYNPRSPLERMICGLIQEIYNKRQSPVVFDTTTDLITDPRFQLLLARDRAEAEWVMRYGAERAVRNVINRIRFGGSTRWAGKRACLMVPVEGKSRGYMQFTDRLNQYELEMVAEGYDRTIKGNTLGRTVVEEMIADLKANQADTLEQIYGPMEITL